MKRTWQQLSETPFYYFYYNLNFFPLCLITYLFYFFFLRVICSYISLLFLPLPFLLCFTITQRRPIYCGYLSD